MKFVEWIKTASEKVVARKHTRLEVFLSTLCLVLSLGIMATTLTTAWIRRQWSTTIAEDNIKIETSGSLAFILEDSSGAHNSISLLSQLGMTGLTLNPVSNLSGGGDGFFYLNKTVAGEEHYVHFSNNSSSAVRRRELAAAQGYIEFSFALLGEDVSQEGEAIGSDYTKYIYLDAASSYIEAYASEMVDGLDPSQAVRISIQDDTKTLIFRNPRTDVTDPDHLYDHTALNSTQINGVWIVDGADYWTPENEVAETFDYMGVTYPLHQTVSAHAFSDFDGGITSVTVDDVTSKYVDPAKCITWFSSNERKTITVRIWLEGTDPVCEDTIAGMRIKLYLSFIASDCDGEYKVIEKSQSSGASTGDSGGTTGEP